MKTLEFAEHELFIFVRTNTIEEYENMKKIFTLLCKDTRHFGGFGVHNNTVVWIHKESFQVGSNSYDDMYASWSNRACFMTYDEFINKYDDAQISLDAIISDLDEKILLMEQRMNHG